VEKSKEIAPVTGPVTGGNVKRVAKVTAGFALLPVGVALLVLPGPGLPVVALSLMLLEDEFRWAGWAREGMTDLGKRGFSWVREKASR
jgi:Putative transmembrane protein (PGPGW)